MKETFVVLAGFLMILVGGEVKAEVTPFTPQGFTISQEVSYAVSVDSLWSAATGDISPWWDHKFSEHPLRFEIEPKAGGGFWEIFDEAGNGVRHATVIFCDPGKLLRMEGPLGLTGNAVQGVWTWEFEKTETGSQLKFTGNLQGQIDAEWAGKVAGVWNHFLVERLQAYVEGRLK